MMMGKDRGQVAVLKITLLEMFGKETNYCNISFSKRTPIWMIMNLFLPLD